MSEQMSLKYPRHQRQKLTGMNSLRKPQIIIEFPSVYSRLNSIPPRQFCMELGCVLPTAMFTPGGEGLVSC